MSWKQTQKKLANYLRGRIHHFMPLGIAPLAPILLFELYALVRHPLGLLSAKKYQRTSRLRLHLGSGGNTKPGWVNLDLSPSADIKVDLRRPFPLPDNCASTVYSEHFLEHLEYPEQATSFIREAYRTLEPGGVIRLAVPDAGLILRSYVLGGTEEYYEAQRKWNPKWFTTQMEHINFCFRQCFEHRFMYDFETLKKLLESCGFNEVTKRDFDPSLDQEMRIVGSLYVSAHKPRFASLHEEVALLESFHMA